MAEIQKRYTHDKQNNPVAVVLSIEDFERMEAIVNNSQTESEKNVPDDNESSPPYFTIRFRLAPPVSVGFGP